MIYPPNIIIIVYFSLGLPLLPPFCYSKSISRQGAGIGWWLVHIYNNPSSIRNLSADVSWCNGFASSLGAADAQLLATAMWDFFSNFEHQIFASLFWDWLSLIFSRNFLFKISEFYIIRLGKYGTLSPRSCSRWMLPRYTQNGRKCYNSPICDEHQTQ